MCLEISTESKGPGWRSRMHLGCRTRLASGCVVAWEAPSGTHPHQCAAYIMPIQILTEKAGVRGPAGAGAEGVGPAASP
jgi:hypothetical protein